MEAVTQTETLELVAGENPHHITRIDIEPDEVHPKRSPTHGWLVRVRRQGVRTSKFFSDKKFGGREGALYEHSVPYRDHLLETLPEPDDPVRRSAEARSLSGVIGLHFLHKDIGNGTRKPYIQLSWIDAGHKRHSASYSIEKWGLRRAVWNGCMRLFKERPDKRDPRVMYEIAYPNILELYGPQPEHDPGLPAEQAPGEAPPPMNVPPPMDPQTEADIDRILSALSR